MRNNKSVLKTQQRFKSERQNVFTKEINKIALSSNEDKKMQSIDSIETYTYGTSKDLLSEKEEYNIKQHNPYRILIIGGSGFGKVNSFNLVNQQPDIDKIYLYTKDPCEAKYQFLIKKSKDVRTKHFNDSKAFIEYSSDIDDIYKNIEE